MDIQKLLAQLKAVNKGISILENQNVPVSRTTKLLCSIELIIFFFIMFAINNKFSDSLSSQIKINFILLISILIRIAGHKYFPEEGYAGCISFFSKKSWQRTVHDDQYIESLNQETRNQLLKCLNTAEIEIQRVTSILSLNAIRREFEIKKQIILKHATYIEHKKNQQSLSTFLMGNSSKNTSVIYTSFFNSSLYDSNIISLISENIGIQSNVFRK